MRKKSKTLILSWLLIICFVFTYSNAVQASTAEELRDLEDQIENSKNNAAAQEKLAKLILQDIQALDESISATNNQIEANKNQKAVVEANLVKAQQDLDKAVADRAYYQKMLDERLAVMYMYGDTGYLDVLFGSTSFSDFIGRINTISSIISYDRKIAEQLKAAEETIAAKKDEIAQENAKLETIINDLKNQEANLEAQKAAKDKKLTEAQNNATYWKAIADQQERDADELRRIMAANNEYGSYGNDFTRLTWPTPGYYGITDYFGYRVHPISGAWRMHNGVDIGVPYGVPIIAPGNGKVIFASYKYSYGNTVILDLGKDASGNQYNMVFAHASRIAVNVGDIVTKGQTLSYVGSTGDSTGPHLHFEVLINGVYKNPLDYVNR